MEKSAVWHIFHVYHSIGVLSHDRYGNTHRPWYASINPALESSDLFLMLNVVMGVLEPSLHRESMDHLILNVHVDVGQVVLCCFVLPFCCVVVAVFPCLS